MITDEINMVKEIFSILDDGIVDRYDSFIFIVKYYDSYFEIQLVATLDGVESADVDTDFDDDKLHYLIMDLKEMMQSRGDDWKSFTLTYTVGGEAQSNFEYT